jgi:hypothetical protein
MDLRQIPRSYRYDNYFDDFYLYHYNSHKQRLHLPMCEALEIECDKLEPMAKVKVNRTLSVDEIDVVQFFVRWKEDFCPKLNVSSIISDYFVNEYKEVSSEIIGYRSLFRAFYKKAKPIVDDFNSELGKKFSIELQIVTPELKKKAVKPRKRKLKPHLLQRAAKALVAAGAKVPNKYLAFLAIKTLNINAKTSSILFSGVRDISSSLSKVS